MELVRQARLLRCASVLILISLLFVWDGDRSSALAAADGALDDYNFAIGLYKQGRWSLAADTFRKFLKTHPNHVKVPYARLYLGLTLVNATQYREAREILRSFVTGYPNSRERPHARYRVAECSYFLDDLPAAEREFTMFLKTNADNPLNEYAYPYLADTQLRLGKPDAAVINFKKSLEVAPKGKLAEDAQFGLARAYEAIGSTSDALPLYRQLASDRAGKHAAEAQFHLATLAFDANDFRSAAHDYDQIEQRFPSSRLLSSARLNAGYAYYQLGDYKTADSRFASARKDTQLALTAGYWLGLTFKARENYGKAVAIFEELFKQHDQSELGENLLYQWADCEFRQQQYASAAERFLQVVTRWPEGQFADESLLFAAEASLMDGQLDKVAPLLERFEKEHAKSGLRMYSVMLRGRWLVARGGEENLKTATNLFRKIVAESQVLRTRSQARIHLARTLLKLEDASGTLETLTPLVQRVKTNNAAAEFAEAFVLQAEALLATKDYAAAVQWTTEYIETFPKGDLIEQALIARALAYGYRGNAENVRKDLQKLTVQFPENRHIARTTHQLAEIAYDNKQWDWAAELFRGLVEMGDRTPFRATALSGLAWSLYQQKEYRTAAEQWARIVQQYPKNELARQAGYLRGIALRDAGERDESAKVFQETMRAYRGTWESYEAAREAARTLKQLDKLKEADAAYEFAHAALLEQPKMKRHQLDQLIDEWALLNYEAKSYERSDEIFRILLRETPESPLADNARFSLAESQLIAGHLDTAGKTFRELASRAQSDNDVRQDALFRLVEIDAEQQQWDKLLQDATELQKQFPDGSYHWDALFYFGEAQLHRGELKESKKTLTTLKAQKENPAVRNADWFPHVWVLLAEAGFRLKQYEDVQNLVNEFLAWDADSPVRYRLDNVVGRAYKNQSRFPEARAALTRVTQSEFGRRTETAAQSQLLIAETFFLQKNYKNALPEYLKVYHLYSFPEWRSAGLFQAALCDEQLNDWNDAAKTYELLLKEFPEAELAQKATTRLEAARKHINP